MATMPELPTMFCKALEAYDEVENFQGSRTSERFNSLVTNACTLCTQALTIVGELDLFSQNESVDDLTSNEIKYMILPALLGYFLTQRNDDRKKCIQMALSAYGKFRDLCCTYGIYKPHTSQNQSSNANSVTTAAARRESKIKRFKEKNLLQEKLAALASTIQNPHVDEDVKRDYHLSLVKRWLCVMEDEVESLNQEEALLSIRPEQLDAAKQETPAARQPIQPFILTRDAAQAAVFGAGYPSLPTMSLDQFYAEQVKRGAFPAPGAVKPASQTGSTVRRIDPSEANRAAEEKKAAEADELEDADDPERLAKARAFDEFKDEHRRGCGNRMNRG